ncbi:MAG TPA: thiamine pyrophosphate-dependent dehydrogenase E1 component subunit alpha [Conexibacter sp.]|nr:thiamine pyrophosphate-dependent dehydrogenase E1 component subunit alpha [Conexibacter sp.]
MIGVSEDREPLPLELAGLESHDLVEWLGTMLLIREFEEALDPLCLSGKIPGGVHVAVGQEAVAVGAMRALGDGDVVTSSHRPHHHGLARGVAPNPMMAELFGRADGTGGGRCGTMHIAAMDRHYYGGNGIVGAGLGLALGAALAAQVRGSGQVALGFFGDGAVNIGRVWEAINMAAAWRLPLIAFCENNLYAVETPTAEVTGGDSIVRRAESFGLPAVQVDGQDAGAVFRVVRAARERALAGEGPTFVEALTYRYQGHNTGQVMSYRTDDEVEEWKSLRDPIARLRIALTAAGRLDDDGFEALHAAARAQVAEATAFADASPWPDLATADAGVTEIDPQLRGNP